MSPLHIYKGINIKQKNNSCFKEEMKDTLSEKKFCNFANYTPLRASRIPKHPERSSKSNQS